MAFEPKNQNIRKALGELQEGRSLPKTPIPKRKERALITASYTLEPENKEKLIRLAEAHGYKKSVSAFLNDWIASVEE
ncbi:hypothetical protein STRDD10_00402 [Streptococcus sp. DD10]|uniref:hypothetical protein n=1 Tax=Streptococcus sp. DD10 TaxID=1777878 RepID=UPI00079A5689|nr:hypothetical protein [Streptococcus sp. DD10]KXT75166.1 hypothetical protein STRDD10_00402 [Streptococcus sp. DD10]